MPYLVLIETSGNQAYIFESNKLLENLGASELVHGVGQFGRQLLSSNIRVREDGKLIGLDWLEPEQRTASASGLIAQVAQFTRALPSSGAELIVAASGKLLVRFDNRESGEQFIRCVTLWATVFAPGLQVHGANVEFSLDSPAAIEQGMGAVHARSLQLLARLPSPLERFQRIPCIVDCTTTRYPAARMVRLAPGRVGPLSAVAIAKRDAAEAGRLRMQRAALGEGDERLPFRLPASLTEVEAIEGVEWLAIIHLDGNGLGSVFAKFSDVAEASDADDYLQKLRGFSAAVDNATQHAFRHAVRKAGELWAEKSFGGGNCPVLPLVPLVLGGDDLTVAIEGRLAVLFAREFLLAFEQASAGDPVISDVAQRREDFPAPYLAACAGIAIVKPHYPFYDAYGLCEQLLRRAKTVKHHAGRAACSAIDFHVLRDSNNADLQRIAAPLETSSGQGGIAVRRLLYHRPCIVTEPERYSNADMQESQRQWIARHRIERLDACIEALRLPSDDGRRTVLSSSFIHRLREALFDGKADERIIKAEQYRKQLSWLRPFCPTDQTTSVFHSVAAGDNAGDGEIRYTQLLDAIENEPFWSIPTKPTPQNPELDN